MKVIFLPGSLCDERLFTHQVAALAECGYDCITADLSGLDSINTMARRVASLTAEPFVAVGLSMGAIVAAELAVQWPDRLRGVALLDTNLNAPDVPQLEQRKAWDAAVRCGGLARLVIDELVPAQTTRPDRHAELIFDMATRYGAANFLSDNRALTNRHDRTSNLDALTVPILIACGADDHVCLPEQHRRLAARRPSAALSVIDGAGHLSTIDKPASVSSLLIDWLKHNLNEIHIQEGNHEYHHA